MRGTSTNQSRTSGSVEGLAPQGASLLDHISMPVEKDTLYNRTEMVVYYTRVFAKGVVTLDDMKNRIITAAIKAVRQYGMEGVRIQNVSRPAGISAGSLYRYFDSTDQLLTECFTHINKQAAEIFEHLISISKPCVMTRCSL